MYHKYTLAHTYIHSCMHAYIHFPFTQKHQITHTYVRTCIHNTHTYMHTYTHTHTHTYIRTHTKKNTYIRTHTYIRRSHKNSLRSVNSQQSAYTILCSLPLSQNRCLGSQNLTRTRPMKKSSG